MLRQRCIREPLGSDSNAFCNVICSKAPHGAAHGKAQIAIHSPIASHGTGVVNVHNEEKAM
jgi:hypothetical protein